MSVFTESVVEDAPLAWLVNPGWSVAHGPDIALDTLAAERADYAEVVLAQRLRGALLPKIITGELRLPAALRNRAAQAGVKDVARFAAGVTGGV